MRSLALAAILLPLASCGRDLALPEEPGGSLLAPPTITRTTAVGFAPGAPGPLPVLAGELVALEGEALGNELASVTVTVGATLAKVVAADGARVVFEVPRLPGPGEYPIALDVPGGRASGPEALRYEGPGAPGTRVVRSEPTSAPIEQLVPLVLSGFATVGLDADPFISTAAYAVGRSSNAELVAGQYGVALSAAPLGILPSSAVGRITAGRSGGFSYIDMEVTGIDRSGRLGRSGVRFSNDPAERMRARAPEVVEPPPEIAVACGRDELLLGISSRGTSGVLFHTTEDDRTQPIPFDPAALSLGTPATALRGRLIGLDALPDDRRFVLGLALAPGVAGSLLQVDAQTGEATPLLAGAAGATAEELLLDVFCTGFTATAIAFRRDGATELLAVAVSNPDAGSALVELDLTAGTMLSHGWVGDAITALAYAQVEQVVETPGGLSRRLAPALFGGISGTLLRFSRVAGLSSPVGFGCGTAPARLDVDASFVLDAVTYAPLRQVGGLIEAPVAGGASRLLATGRAGSVVVFLAQTLTLYAEVLRSAPFGPLTVLPLQYQGAPVALAEHTQGGQFGLDAASTALLLPLSGDPSVAVGPPGYGRGAAFVGGDRPLLALSSAPIDGSPREAARPDSLVTVDPSCQGLHATLEGLQQAPLALAQGPASRGAFGPSSAARLGGAAAPAFALTAHALLSVPTAGDGVCGLGDLEQCPALVEVPLELPAGRSPFDLTVSADEAVVAIRTTDDDACTDPACPAGSCRLAPELLLARPGSAELSLVVLPSAPLSLVADRSGVFLASVRCPGAEASCAADLGCEGRLLYREGRGEAGALLVIDPATDSVACLAGGIDLAGVVALPPNGTEAWVSAPSDGRLALVRLGLSRSAVDGTLDLEAQVTQLERVELGEARQTCSGFAPSGIAFVADGATGLVSLPEEYRIAILQ